MKTKSLFLFIRYLFLLFLFVGWGSSATVGHVYVNPKVLAKQYLAEQDFKATLTNIFSNRANCNANLKTVGVAGGELQSITEGLDVVIKIGICNRSACQTESECLNKDSLCNGASCSNGSCDTKAKCLDKDDRCNGGNGGTAGRWTPGRKSTWNANRFNDKNVEIVRMEVINDGGDDRTFKAYYKRTGLETYNTIDNQTCSKTEYNEGCYEATCSLEYNAGSRQCRLLSCCRECWSISGGLQ